MLTKMVLKSDRQGWILSYILSKSSMKLGKYCFYFNFFLIKKICLKLQDSSATEVKRTDSHRIVDGLWEMSIWRKKQTCHFSGIFRVFGIANLQHWIFFSFLDVVLMFLEKSHISFFWNKTNAIVACLKKSIFRSS